MPPLFDYQPTYMVNHLVCRTTIMAPSEQKPLNDSQNDSLSTSIGITDTYLNYDLKISNEYKNTLFELINLKDDWDEDGALAPTKKVIESTISLLSTLNKIGQPTNSISVGYSGEVAINLKSGNKVFEIIFYAIKSKFAKFNKDTKESEQGFYEEDTLYKLLNWLNQQHNAV